MTGPQLTPGGADAPRETPGGGAVSGRAVRVERLVAATPSPHASAPPRRGRGVAVTLGVLALVALVAALSDGLPGRVRGGTGGSLSAHALLGDAAAVVLVLALAGLAWMVYDEWADRERRKRGRRRLRLRIRRPRFDPQLLAVPLLLAAGAALLLALVALLGGGSTRSAARLPPAALSGLAGLRARRAAAAGGGGVPVDPVALIVTAAVVALAVAALALRARRRRAGSAAAPTEEDALVAALDDSLADLAGEPDPRRAVIKAYDRMERALAAGGAPRGRAETPLEYLRRALAAVRASQGSIRRLTDLFELARFSAHVIDAAAKQEAIAALTALRAELDADGAT